MKEIGLPLLLLTALASPALAADCQPNGIGGSFCINDDGTTTDTVPNEVNGMDTYSNNGVKNLQDTSENTSVPLKCHGTILTCFFANCF